jgi:hypothetical protein
MNQSQSNVKKNFEGEMFLYDQPQLLTVEEHGRLGLNTTSGPYEFCRSIRVVPLAAAEIPSAQKYYPIVFSDLEKPSLLAVVGVFEDRNLFVDDDGLWDRSVYVPAYVRCHPFALASRRDDQYAVVIDRAAKSISENPEQPFFEGRDLAPAIQARVDLCAQFNAHTPATQAFCDQLVELGLLSGQQANFTPQDGEKERPIATYVAVDFDKLQKLPASKVENLFSSGMLSALYGHRFSLENWFRLLERRDRQAEAGMAQK